MAPQEAHVAGSDADDAWLAHFKDHFVLKLYILLCFMWKSAISCIRTGIFENTPHRTFKCQQELPIVQFGINICHLVLGLFFMPVKLNNYLSFSLVRH